MRSNERTARRAVKRGLKWLDDYIAELDADNISQLSRTIITAHQLLSCGAGLRWQRRLDRALEASNHVRSEVEKLPSLIMHEGTLSSRLLDYALVLHFRHIYLNAPLPSLEMEIAIYGARSAIPQKALSAVMSAYLSSKLGFRSRPMLVDILSDKKSVEAMRYDLTDNQFLDYLQYVAHRVFCASDYGQRPIPEGFLKEEQQVLKSEIDAHGPDLTAEITWALSQFNTLMPELIERGVQRLVKFQKKDGSWTENFNSEKARQLGFEPDLLRWHTTFVSTTALLASLTLEK